MDSSRWRGALVTYLFVRDLEAVPDQLEPARVAFAHVGFRLEHDGYFEAVEDLSIMVALHWRA